MADNPFSVDVVNPLQALLIGQQAYDSGMKANKERATEATRTEAGQLYATNPQGAIAKLLGANDYAGAGNLATIQKGLAPETSADIQAFKMAQGQGFKGGILDFMKQKAEAGAARTNINTNVNNKGETEFDKAVGKDYGETFVGINKAARDSVGARANLDLMEKLVDDPNFYSGTAGDLVTKFKKAAVAVGLDAPEGSKANELFSKVSKKSVLDQAGGSLGAGFSNADRDYLNATVPNIDNTKEGNRAIIGIMRKAEERKQQVAQLAREYAKSHGGRIDTGFDQALAQWTEKNPLFTGAGTPAAAKAGGNRTSTGVGWTIE